MTRVQKGCFAEAQSTADLFQDWRDIRNDETRLEEENTAGATICSARISRQSKLGYSSVSARLYQERKRIQKLVSFRILRS